LAHQGLFGAPISENSVFAVLQSYPRRAIEFWRSFVGFKNTGLAIIACAMLYAAILRTLGNTKVSTASLLVGAVVLAFGLYSHKTFTANSPSLVLISQSIESYEKEIDEFEAVNQNRQSQASSVVQDQKHENNLSIFIIGESVNKNHLSAYGYPRRTTPQADEKIASGELLRFTQAYSNHTHSNSTLSFMLTAANQYNAKKWVNAASILNIASLADTKTTWLSNHRMLGGWSNNITVLTKEADYVQTINSKIGRGNASTAYDEALLPLLAESIEENPSQAVFLHFYNSHVDYCQRYPSTFDSFEGSIASHQFGRRATIRKTNSRNLKCYDNTILYTDQLLAKLWSQFETSSQPTVISYIADHAEEVFDTKAHNSAIFDYEMTEIPLLIWANTAWKEQHAMGSANQQSTKSIHQRSFFRDHARLARN
jgi:heptose-I-phosphate ethanolaminephosphotransferase